MEKDDLDFDLNDYIVDDDFKFDIDLDALGIEEADKRPMHEQKKEELSKVVQLFKERAKNEQRTFEDNTDSEYWIAICFQNRAQKEEFLLKAKLLELGDKYLDGVEVAEALGIQLQTMPKFHKFKIDTSYIDLV